MSLNWRTRRSDEFMPYAAERLPVVLGASALLARLSELGCVCASYTGGGIGSVSENRSLIRGKPINKVGSGIIQDREAIAWVREDCAGL